MTLDSYLSHPMTAREVQDVNNRLKSFEAIPRFEIGCLVATCKAYHDKFGPLEPAPVEADPVARGEVPLFGEA